MPTGSQIGPATGRCLKCGTRAPIVNYTVERITGVDHELGYIGGHHRPGTRAGTRCSGSYGGWTDLQVDDPHVDT